MTYHKLFTSPKALVNTLTIFIAGIFWYYTSSAISASNTVLIPHVISRADYKLATSIGLGAQFIGKFSSGAIIDWLNTPKAIYFTAGVLTVATSIIFTFYASPDNSSIFISTVALIKVLSGFSRLSLFKILAMWYPSSVFGLVGACFQIVACIGESTSRIVVGQLNKHLPWTTSLRITALITSIALLAIAIFVQPNPPVEGTPEATLSTPKFYAFGAFKSLRGAVYILGSVWRAIIRTPSRIYAKISHSNKYSSDHKGATSLEEGKPIELKMNFWKAIAWPLLKQPKFWLVALMSFCATSIRLVIMEFSPQYFQNVVGWNPGDSGSFSAVSTSVSILGIFFAGFIYDKSSKFVRLFLPLAFYTVTALGACGWYIYTSEALSEPILRGRLGNPSHRETAIVVTFEVLTCLALAAPSSYLDSIYVLEMAGKNGAAFGSGSIGGIGLLGGALASYIIGGETGSHAGWCTILKWFMCIAFTLVALSAILAFAGLRKLRSQSKLEVKNTPLVPLAPDDAADAK